MQTSESLSWRKASQHGRRISLKDPSSLLSAPLPRSPRLLHFSCFCWRSWCFRTQLSFFSAVTLRLMKIPSRIPLPTWLWLQKCLSSLVSCGVTRGDTCHFHLALPYLTPYNPLVPACMVLAALDVLYARFPSPGLFPNLPASSIVKMLPAAAFEVALGLLRDPKNSLVVAPVAFLYLLQNNILYVALRNLSAPIFQVCYQTKLVTTALLSVMMIEGRVYSRIQWTALVALSFGVAIAVMTGDGGSSESDSSAASSLP